MCKLVRRVRSFLVRLFVEFEEREELLFGVSALHAFEGLLVGGSDGLAGPAHADALKLLGLHRAKNQL